MVKINRLYKNIKPKKVNRKTKFTSVNNSKTKNIKNVLNIIKQQSVKENNNLINRKNIIHHHTTNIINMTQKNYFSNVIINNYKTKDEHKTYSTSQSKSKAPLNMTEIHNEKNIIKDYFKKYNIRRLILPKKNNLNLKFKNNLQKLLLKEEIFLKNFSKHNSQSKNCKDIKGKKDTEEDKIHTYLHIRNKYSNSKINESGCKTIPNNNSKKKKGHYKSKALEEICNLKFINIKKNSNIENTFRQSILSSNNIDLLNNSKKDKLKNSSIINSSVESKEIRKNNLYNQKKLDKFFSSNININFDKKMNRNIINNSSIENISNRSYNYKNKNFDISKINNNSNIIFNISGVKKIDKIKKNYLYLKNNLNYKKCPKLNLKQFFRIDKFVKNDSISQSINFQKQVQSQRNKPTQMNKNKKNPEVYHYLNSFRINENKNSNNSYMNGNNHHLGNISSNIPFYLNYTSKILKIKDSQNNIRNNKDIIPLNCKSNNNNNNNNHLNNTNIFSNTNESIKNNSNIIKSKKYLYTNNNTINSNLNSNLIHKNIINNNRVNINNYYDKYMDSKKLFSSLRKKINFKSNIINNNNINTEKKLQNNTQNNITNNKDIENKKLKSNNSKQLNVNKINKDSKYLLNKNSFNHFITLKKKLNKTSLKNDKKNHKKIKSMKGSLLKQKSKKKQRKITNNFKNLNIKINNLNDIGLFIYNTDGNSNNVNYINISDIKFNTIDNNNNNNTNNQSINQHKINNTKKI